MSSHDHQPKTLDSQLEALQTRIGYRFGDARLLLQATTHPSFVNEHPEEGPDNQRLEFLGDAVLGFVVAEWVFRQYQHFREGEMTRLRAALVREETIAGFASQLRLGETLRLGRGEADGGGRERPANLGDAFEALMGAIYLDGGLAPLKRIIHTLVKPAAEDILDTEADRDAKSLLQEWSQGDLGITPRYRIVAERGPDHAKTFVAEVLLDDEVIGRGQGRSKQAAERAAARQALRDRAKL
jgi:ribonuclease-3